MDFVELLYYLVWLFFHFRVSTIEDLNSVVFFNSLEYYMFGCKKNWNKRTHTYMYKGKMLNLDLSKENSINFFILTIESF